MSVRERASGIKNNAGFVKKKICKTLRQKPVRNACAATCRCKPRPGCVVSEASGGVVGGRTILPLTPL